MCYETAFMSFFLLCGIILRIIDERNLLMEPDFIHWNLLDCGCFIQSELRRKVIFEAKQVINFDERLQRQSCTLE